ncbi:gamma-glutamyltranspeptidase/glutathione hydrolase [Methylomarinovum tepidoasis]|uniref:Glutathione hydrolase proenzyme n=1 Tax=Methylomarinovum tepidoasis TaxID=2840183 RepID=A0AAU9CEU3_9GAMM|nr:gamma-glutamyltransferase [Methylomarinovum sp. IN45]BCX89341.1 gamma-glutamyltranspeptidase/glutathione hydrolase [Methylomarinovum sp. IN45]
MRSFLLLWLAWSVALWAGPKPPQAAIASAHPLATAAGFEILDQGGNAFDAAVAVAAALAVVEPAGSGLGGGGFLLLHRARDGRQVMLDARETAPLAARRDMYLDAAGNPIPRASIDGPLAAGIPGMPAALAHLAENYGRLPLRCSLAPAIRYAREGFVVGPRYLEQVERRHAVLGRYPAAAAIFLEKGQVPRPGFRLVQPDLARVLEALAARGRAGFYDGWVAERLLAGVRAAGGVWSRADLARYRVVERRPVVGRYHNVRVVSAAPPSSGGVVLVETLNILSAYPLTHLDPATAKHLIVEAWRRAYRDQALYLGDPDFVSMPLRRLLSPDYAAGLRAAIRPDRALPSAWLAAGPEAGGAGADTTHFSILDRDGNRVAATLSINYLFGSGFVVPGTGVLLNDEMDDFAIKPGVPNLYGLVGGSANAIAPGKRMLSSMTPTFLETPDRIAVLGTPGGSRIISMVTLAALDFAAGFRPALWVAWPRFHHQYLPDEIQYEPDALSGAERRALHRRGHRLKALGRTYGNMQAILWDRFLDRVEAASDPRGGGSAVVR